MNGELDSEKNHSKLNDISPLLWLSYTKHRTGIAIEK